jgi:hypothetical protein
MIDAPSRRFAGGETQGVEPVGVLSTADPRDGAPAPTPTPVAISLTRVA